MRIRMEDVLSPLPRGGRSGQSNPQLHSQECSGESTENGDGMSGENGDSSQQALRLMENTQLPQHRATVVVDFFAGETVVGVEGVDAAKRELDAARGGREAAPRAEMSAANKDFDEDGVVGDMFSLNLDLQVGEGLHELLVKLGDTVLAGIVFAPGLVVVARRSAEGAENTIEVMLVLQPNVLFDNSDASRLAVFRERCGCHSHLHRANTAECKYYYEGRSF